jgi:hypothetical protein
MDIIWEDPPSYRKSAKAFVAELAKHPGKWAIYRTDLTSTGSGSAYRQRYPECDWATRKAGEKKWTLYVRYREEL